MTSPGGRRRAWRFAMVLWALAVAGGGGLTLWLQAGTGPREPYVWERTRTTPAPPPVADGDDGGCPRRPPAVPSAAPSSLPPALPSGPDIMVCAYASLSHR
ncbi:hypothetical protein ACJ6WF_28180 [Streptomyces sp. MMS24-I2-30]|uniref:hypothetical protein n=1 Tax=Streptomyces sp. MMS24-I2-30 TaxID=3351564 RepID=UPI003896D0E9